MPQFLCSLSWDTQEPRNGLETRGPGAGKELEIGARSREISKGEESSIAINVS